MVFPHSRLFRRIKNHYLFFTHIFILYAQAKRTVKFWVTRTCPVPVFPLRIAPVHVHKNPPFLPLQTIKNARPEVLSSAFREIR